MEKKPGGALRLLTKEDTSKPFVGWRPTQDAEGCYNPIGFGMAWVVVQKVLDNGTRQDLYEQPMFFESPGVIIVCRAGEKIGLVENFRMVGERLFPAGKEYVQRLSDEGRLGDLVNSLGKWCWEVPRGIAQVTGETDLKQLILKSTKAEGLEEAGFALDDVRVLGRLNGNPTFFMHPQYVVGARIVGTDQANPEGLEIIGKARLFSPAEIRELADRGELEDGVTLAAFALAGVRLF